MVSDEEWSHAPDWSKFTPKKILKKRCNCPDSAERRCVGCSYSGTKFYWCRNCGKIYEEKTNIIAKLLKDANHGLSKD